MRPAIDPKAAIVENMQPADGTLLIHLGKYDDHADDTRHMALKCHKQSARWGLVFTMLPIKPTQNDPTPVLKIILPNALITHIVLQGLLEGGGGEVGTVLVFFGKAADFL